MEEISGVSKAWYALKVSRPFEAQGRLKERGVETYLPVEMVKREDGSMRRYPLVPKLLFIRTTRENGENLEAESRVEGSGLPSFWIYRYHRGGEIQPIRDEEMRLFRLLTADDPLRCEVYHKAEFRIGDRLRVTGGPFAGYEGYARRIRKNKHIVVEIEGVCAIALPFIHPDLLERSGS